MLLWGFILLVGGALISLILFLSNVADIFSRIGAHGFGGYIDMFFATENVTTEKTFFMIAVAAMVLGLILYIVGRIRNKGEENPIIPVKVKKFFRDTKSEMKKITWPNFPSVVRNTGVVLAMCAATGLIIVVVDLGLSALVDLLQGL